MKSSESAPPSIAITGVTGVLGRLTAQHLAADGLPLLLLARDPNRAPHLPNSSVAAVDYQDREASTTALRGVETLFMVSAAENENRLAQHRTFIDGAAAAGVRTVVYTSFAGAAPDATFTLARDHHATEEHLKRSGMNWTFLRDNFYIDFISSLVGDDGVIRGPAGAGRVAAVTRTDVAASAAAVLQHPDRHKGVTYQLTGPEALTMTDIATVLTTSRGSQVTYIDETVAEAYASRARWGAPAWQTDAWVTTYTAIAAGELEQVSTDVEKLTGRVPQSLADYLTFTR